MKKTLWMMMISFVAIALSACGGGGSSGGGAFGASSQDFSTDQREYQNYTSGVLANGESFVTAPKNLVDRSYHDSYYRCLSSF